MDHKLESRLPGEITISDMQMPHSNGRKRRGTKADLKLKVQKVKIMASGPITSWQIEGEKGGSSDRLPLLGLQNHCGW